MKDVPISRLTSFQNDGVVSTVIRADAPEELADLFQAHQRICLLGRGSNSLIDPSVSEVVYLQVSDTFLPIRCEGDLLTVSAGCSVNALLSFCRKEGLMGLTFAAGVPASVGGMVAMNFGCWGQEVSDCLDAAWVRLPSGELSWVPAAELGFAYRTSHVLTEGWLVLGARFRVSRATSAEVRDDIHAKVEKRLSTQPLRGKTFGSIFKNPDGDFAGRLIESAGLKGCRVGGAALSEQHANFMVNEGGATVEDVQGLIAHVQDVVSAKSGIILDCEVQYLP